MLDDDELLEFDHDRVGRFKPARARRLLREHGDIYRAQLVAARWIDGWRERDATHDVLPRDESERRGFDEALREVVAHLRLGDLLPGGVLYKEEQRRSRPVR